jgi:hypothetical protein
VVKAEHAFPSRADVKNEWSSTSNPSYVVMAWTGAAVPSTLFVPPYCVDVLYVPHNCFLSPTVSVILSEDKSTSVHVIN